MLETIKIQTALEYAALRIDEDFTVIGQDDSNITEIHFDERLDVNGSLYLLRKHCKPHTFTLQAHNIVKVN